MQREQIRVSAGYEGYEDVEQLDVSVAIVIRICSPSSPRTTMNSVDPAMNADAGPSQPRPTDPQTANITVLANRRFPVPPSYYVEFTPERWKRYQRIRSDCGKSQSTSKGKEKVLGDADETDAMPAAVDEWADRRPQERSDIDDLAIFQPPRIDWIKREDTWNAFGRLYQVSRDA